MTWAAEREEDSDWAITGKGGGEKKGLKRGRGKSTMIPSAIIDKRVPQVGGQKKKT